MEEENNNYNGEIGTFFKEEKEKNDFIKPLLIVVLFLFIGALFFSRTDNNESVINLELKKDNKAFQNLNLEAKAALVWDINNNEEIYSKNPESQLPLASLSKVVMAITALDKVPENTIVVISERDLLPEGDNGLLAGEKWTLKELLDFILIVSSNDGTSAVANVVGSTINKDDTQKSFVDLMNQTARNIGLNQTYFTSPSGLDKDDIVPGGNGSARDMATLFSYTIKEFPSVLEPTREYEKSFNSLSNFLHEAENTNDLVAKLPGIVASKTGFTDLAGGNLVVVFEPEPTRPIVLVVLGSSLEGRFEDIEKLYLTTLGYINS